MAGGLFGWLDAIGLWWSSIFTGNRKKLLEDPEVAGEILRRAIDAQVADFGKHKDAVAELMAIVIGDKKTLERLQAEMRELEEESEGAVAAAKERAAALQRAGKTAAEIEADPTVDVMPKPTEPTFIVLTIASVTRCGAFSPLCIVHALTSFGPPVKKLINPRE